jgi:hypothetical protein
VSRNLRLPAVRRGDTRLWNMLPILTVAVVVVLIWLERRAGKRERLPTEVGTAPAGAPFPERFAPDASTAAAERGAETAVRATDGAAPAAPAKAPAGAAPGGAAPAEPAPIPTQAEETTEVPNEGEGWVRGDGSTGCPEDFPIKGKSNSRIYHLPGGPSYGATVPDLCFATEEAAAALGYRPRKR